MSLVIGLITDRDNALGNAIAKGGWLIIAGFVAALIGSMAGVPEESLLFDDIGTTAGWGMVYYTGLLLTKWYIAAHNGR
jgi:hypothetical protein